MGYRLAKSSLRFDAHGGADRPTKLTNCEEGEPCGEWELPAIGVGGSGIPMATGPHRSSTSAGASCGRSASLIATDHAIETWPIKTFTLIGA
jgi:hypothetical protein